METIYLLSGLGADYRAFQKLNLQGYNLIFVDWITPVKEESIVAYAKRLLPQITEKRPILIGLSFGGMVALEISKFIETDTLFLISSARNRNDLPSMFSSLMSVNPLKLIPDFLLKKSNYFLEYLMGVHQKENKDILAEIIADTDIPFLFWALKAMTKWENDIFPNHLVEIHGTLDRLIPFRQTDNMNAVENGGHLMVLDKAPVIEKIILDYLCQRNKN